MSTHPELSSFHSKDHFLAPKLNFQYQKVSQRVEVLVPFPKIQAITGPGVPKVFIDRHTYIHVVTLQMEELLSIYLFVLHGICVHTHRPIRPLVHTKMKFKEEVIKVLDHRINHLHKSATFSHQCLWFSFISKPYIHVQ